MFLQICFGHVRSATAAICTLTFDPIVLTRTFIQRACNAVPGTGKHVNNNNQVDEELAHAHFEYAEKKHEKTSYEFRIRYCSII